MKAVRVIRHGDPTEALEVQDVPIPEPGPGEVRIAVSAASLNFGDIARCRGTVASVMGQIPFTLGMDVCGVVDAAGEGAEEWADRRVVAMAKQSLGGIAEYAIAPTTGTFDAPPSLDDATAAGFKTFFSEAQGATDYANNIQTLVDKGCTAIVTVGFLQTQATIDAARARLSCEPTLQFEGGGDPVKKLSINCKPAPKQKKCQKFVEIRIPSIPGVQAQKVDVVVSTRKGDVSAARAPTDPSSAFQRPKQAFRLRIKTTTAGDAPVHKVVTTQQFPAC